MLRIWMGREDIARTRLAIEPLPLHEVVISLWALRIPRLPPRLSGWRRQTISRLPAQTRQLFEIVRHNGSPGFLTRLPPDGDLDSALDVVLSTPPERIRRDLAGRLGGRTPTPWLRDLASGGREAQRTLESVVRRYHDTCLADGAALLAPYAQLDANQRTLTLSTQGVEGMINSLHPSIRWRHSRIEIDGLCSNNFDLHPEGNGVIVLPSSFAPRPVVGFADGAVIVAYPINTPAHTKVLRRPEPASDPLAKLIGRTRAAVLRAARTGATTSQLAHMVGISVPAASQHTSALRAAGLLSTKRAGKSVHHSTTPLAEALLHSSTQ